MEDQRPNIKDQNKFQVQGPKNRSRYDLRGRLFKFAKRILKISKSLPRIPECENVRRQLAAAGTSIGANFEEADGALTKKDFVNKTGISRKEAKETRFWLKAIDGTFIKEGDLAFNIRESEEIINILSSILINCGVKPWR